MHAIDNDDLRAIDLFWYEEPARVFAGKRWLQMRVRIVTLQPMRYRTTVVASMQNHHGQFRPAAQWDVEVEELVEVVEIRTFRVWISTFDHRRSGRKSDLKLAA